MASATILVPLTPTRVWESAYQSAKWSLTHTMVISKPKTTPMVLYFCLHYQKKRRKTFHAAKSKYPFIEDERNILTFVRKLLYGHNYKVTTAITGTEGLQLINSICPDLILLDLGLPDMDGQTIIRQVREWSDCPIIVISARTNEHEKVKLSILARMIISPSHSVPPNSLHVSAPHSDTVPGWIALQISSSTLTNVVS